MLRVRQEIDAEIDNICDLRKPLLVATTSKMRPHPHSGESIKARRTLWRYREVLPQASQ